MRVLLDTNRYRDFCAGDADLLDLVQRAERLYLPFVVVAELRAGFLSGTVARRNEAVLTRFLNSPRVAVLYADEDTTHHFARVYAQLRAQGTPMPTHDLWIAALALQYDLLLATRDRHFDHLPQLARAV